MAVREITRVGVVGAGTMGAGIAQIVAAHGIPVAVVEVDAAAVERGLDRVRADLDRNVARERLSGGEADAIAGRITGDTDFAVLGDADLVIEAVPERLAMKQAAFQRIDEVVSSDTIIATNTSSLPVIDIAVHASRPNRVLGFHFFNPAPVMPLIELVRTVVTDQDVVDTARRFAESIGKEPVVVGDRRGFIANQLLFPYLNQAVGMVESGAATKEDVDAAMRLGAGLPMGPLALVDLVGLDTMVGIMDAIHSQFDDPRYAPRPILRQLVTAGYTGRKSGRGFYTYEGPGSPRVVDSATARPDADPDTIADWGTVGVVGAGPVASGLATALTEAGFDVVARDDAADLAELADCQLVVEAMAGDLDATRDVVGALDRVLDAAAVIATTTSELPVIACAMAADHPERVLGLHLVDAPVDRSAPDRLVEVVRTVRTDDQVVEQARAVVDRLGFVGVLAQDRAGFIVDALLLPHLNDAIAMLDSHYATADEIDTAMTRGCAYPMGPFELLDAIGLDVALATIDRLHAEFHEPSLQAQPLLRQLVGAGFSGREAGRGFHVHE